MSINLPAQSIVAKLTTVALAPAQDAHARQRELVRASLLAR